MTAAASTVGSSNFNTAAVTRNFKSNAAFEHQYAADFGDNSAVVDANSFSTRGKVSYPMRGLPS